MRQDSCLVSEMRPSLTHTMQIQYADYDVMKRNGPFHKIAAANSNRLILKMYISTRKRTFTAEKM